MSQGKVQYPGDEFPLIAYLELLGKRLPLFMQSIESMHTHIKRNYSPGALPPRYRKENLCRCPDIASPEALFTEPIGMQIVLMSCGILSHRPFLRVVLLHNALIYLTERDGWQTKSQEANAECDCLVTDLLWMLFTDTSRIAIQWDAICANVLSTKILPVPPTGISEFPAPTIDGYLGQAPASPVMNYIKNKRSRAVKVLRRKYGKEIKDHIEQPIILDRIHAEHTDLDSGWQRIFASLRAESMCVKKIKKRHCPFRAARDDDFLTCSFVASDDIDPIHNVARLNLAFHRVRNLARFLHNLPSVREQSFRDLIRLAKGNGPMLVVAPSQISAAGYGVYVCGFLPANTRLGLYSGIFVPKNQTLSGRKPHQTGEDTGYLLHNNATTNIDGGSVRPLVAMINDYRDRKSPAQRPPNCRFSYSRNLRAIRTTRAVQNEELLVYYGSAYKLNSSACVASLLRMRYGEHAHLYDWPYQSDAAVTILETMKE